MIITANENLRFSAASLRFVAVHGVVVVRVISEGQPNISVKKGRVEMISNKGECMITGVAPDPSRSTYEATSHAIVNKNSITGGTHTGRTLQIASLGESPAVPPRSQVTVNDPLPSFVVVDVRPHTLITIEDEHRATYVIGDTDGPVSFRGPGGMLVTGRISSVDLNSRGLRAAIAEVSGDYLVVVDTIDVAVVKGKVDRADITILGGGSVAYAGEAAVAALTGHSTSKISVQRVTQHLMRRPWGDSEIHVAEEPPATEPLAEEAE